MLAFNISETITRYSKYIKGLVKKFKNIENSMKNVYKALSRFQKLYIARKLTLRRESLTGLSVTIPN
jgi:hypothetical protein